MYIYLKPLLKVKLYEEPQNKIYSQIKAELLHWTWGGGSGALPAYLASYLLPASPVLPLPQWLQQSYLQRCCEKPTLKTTLSSRGDTTQSNYNSTFTLNNRTPYSSFRELAFWSSCIASFPILQELRAALWPGPFWRAKSSRWEPWSGMRPDQTCRCFGNLGLSG